METTSENNVVQNQYSEQQLAVMLLTTFQHPEECLWVLKNKLNAPIEFVIEKDFICLDMTGWIV